MISRVFCLWYRSVWVSAYRLQDVFFVCVCFSSWGFFCSFPCLQEKSGEAAGVPEDLLLALLPVHQRGGVGGVRLPDQHHHWGPAGHHTSGWELRNFPRFLGGSSKGSIGKQKGRYLRIPDVDVYCLPDSLARLSLNSTWIDFRVVLENVRGEMDMG